MRGENKAVKKPKYRSALRLKLGTAYYSLARYMLWIKLRRQFSVKRSEKFLPSLYFEHKTILLRKLKDVDMQLQHNKITNLKIAAECLNKITVYPGEIFSFWYLIKKPTANRGFVEGMVLKNGTVDKDIGGGLCQLSNLIFWLTLHTSLTIIERHRHGYDVFPDSNRTQPFGSGATCYYPHGDLMIKNETDKTFQLLITVGEEYLHGQWRCDVPSNCTYNIVERNHIMKSEYWGGYSRHNELYRQTFDLSGNMLCEELVVKNSAIMMYPPFLSESRLETTEYMR